MSSTDGKSSWSLESIAASSGSTSSQNQIQIVASPSRLNNIVKVALNELLSSVNVHRNCSNIDALINFELNYFLHENITKLKRLLVQEFNSVTRITKYLTDRRISSARPAHKAELEDTIGILDVADTVHAMRSYSFVVASLPWLLKHGPGEINLAVVADRQLRWMG
jgi:hypothetical protein